jgi:hypothetical protein
MEILIIKKTKKVIGRRWFMSANIINPEKIYENNKYFNLIIIFSANDHFKHIHRKYYEKVLFIFTDFITFTSP